MSWWAQHVTHGETFWEALGWTMIVISVICAVVAIVCVVIAAAAFIAAGIAQLSSGAISVLTTYAGVSVMEAISLNSALLGIDLGLTLAIIGGAALIGGIALTVGVFAATRMVEGYNRFAKLVNAAISAPSAPVETISAGFVMPLQKQEEVIMTMEGPSADTAAYTDNPPFYHTWALATSKEEAADRRRIIIPLGMDVLGLFA